MIILKSKVYFSKNLDSKNLITIYKKLGINLNGRVAVKVHSGEKGNQNFLHPEYFKDIIDYVKGTVVECNTAYDGARNNSQKHKALLKEHEWTKYFPVDLLDEEGPDKEVAIPNGKIIQKNYLGKNIDNYDSMLVLSHFKGHPMGGYGGALKQLSIGCASSYGKAYIHGAGDPKKIWTADHDSFLASMADAASSVINLFPNNIAYINIMCNMSVDCDCCATAEDPCIEDIGILASTDPVAIDKACLDLVYNSQDPNKEHLIERIESRNGIHTIHCAKDLGLGTTDYELINID